MTAQQLLESYRQAYRKPNNLEFWCSANVPKLIALLENVERFASQRSIRGSSEARGLLEQSGFNVIEQPSKTKRKKKS